MFCGPIPHRDRAGSVRQLDHHAALPRRRHGLLVWEILDWFMATAVAMALPVNFAHKISLRRDEPDGLLIRRYLETSLSFYASLVLTSWFFWNWFHALLAGERVRPGGRDLPRQMGVHQPATSSWFATPPACTCCQTRRATDPPVGMWPVAPAGPRRLRRPPYHARKLRAPPAPIRL